MMTATYDPEDNKLRLRSSSRLDAETYARVKAAGFAWAPKQDLFVAPAWSPEREDLLVELCGEIGDEDTSLVERAEDRAERFETYSEKRMDDAEQARKAVAAIADNIPLGQPILVGHHSERHARKDQQRIENGMRKAVQMWQTSKYWEDRAAGAIRHAKYKERPDVRHRRIKGIEADKRKQERVIAEAETRLKLWDRDGLTLEQARVIANYASVNCAPTEHGSWWSAWDVLRPDEERYKACPSWTVGQVQEAARERFPRRIAHARRWIEHYDNRLAYERAMLAETTGVRDVADRWPNIEPGGRVMVGSEWCTVVRVNKTAGKVASLTTNRRYVRKVGIEEVADYTAPSASEAEAVKVATKLPPLCNYRTPGCVEMTAAEWKRGTKASDSFQVRTVDASAEYVAHRLRHRWQAGGGYKMVPVFLTDEKLKFPPAADEVAAVAAEEGAETPSLTPPAPDLPKVIERAVAREAKRNERDEEAAKEQVFRELQNVLKSGNLPRVEVVHATGFYPTPPAIAALMVEKAGGLVAISGARILEPSAGSGNIIDAIHSHSAGFDTFRLVAVELHAKLAEALRRKNYLYANEYRYQVRQADFLECTPEDLGTFGLILMNPPFDGGADIRHIEHARKLLKPGGRLVAICANGPRQNAQLRPMVEDLGGEWEELPADTFKEAGTSVRTALLWFDEPAADEAIAIQPTKAEQASLFA